MSISLSPIHKAPSQTLYIRDRDDKLVRLNTDEKICKATLRSFAQFMLSNPRQIQNWPISRLRRYRKLRDNPLTWESIRFGFDQISKTERTPPILCHIVVDELNQESETHKTLAAYPRLPLREDIEEEFNAALTFASICPKEQINDAYAKAIEERPWMLFISESAMQSVQRQLDQYESQFDVYEILGEKRPCCPTCCLFGSS